MVKQESIYEMVAEYYQQHCDELRVFVRDRVGRMDIAEDLVQNLFLRVLSLQMITRSTLPSLVYTIAKNLVNDYWRHRRFVEEYERVIRYSWENGAGMVDAASVYSVHEVYSLLENGIAQLSTKQQQVYRLHIYEGMKVSEISETLHINYKSVENRLGVARKQVRNYISRMLAS